MPYSLTQCVQIRPAPPGDPKMYVKSGDPPRRNDLRPNEGLGPESRLFACPSFNPQTYIVSNNQPECDRGLTAGDFPPRQWYAQYGIVFPGF